MYVMMSNGCVSSRFRPVIDELAEISDEFLTKMPAKALCLDLKIVPLGGRSVVILTRMVIRGANMRTKVSVVAVVIPVVALKDVAPEL